jgi:uncharacterized protein (DUF924 family)
MGKTPSAADILNFWFVETTPEFWFKKDDDFDAAIKDRFGKTVTKALAGKLDHWANDAEGCLALILMLDQFTRNIFRHSARAFSGDEMALALSLRCVERKYLDADKPFYCQFMLMPMMHSEEIDIQDMSLPLFETYTSKLTHEYAIKHRDIIARFGRFPHRNAILGRPNNSEEDHFLTQPGSSF